MTDPERRTQPSRQRQEEARADWLRRTLERAPRPLSPETRRKLAALLAPFGHQSPPGHKLASRHSHADNRGVRVGRIVPGDWPGSGNVKGDGV
jgi:hypothetical protein